MSGDPHENAFPTVPAISEVFHDVVSGSRLCGRRRIYPQRVDRLEEPIVLEGHSQPVGNSRSVELLPPVHPDPDRDARRDRGRPMFVREGEDVRSVGDRGWTDAVAIVMHARCTQQ
jgi:hypothetical protein